MGRHAEVNDGERSDQERSVRLLVFVSGAVINDHLLIGLSQNRHEAVTKLVQAREVQRSEVVIEVEVNQIVVGGEVQHIFGAPQLLGVVPACRREVKFFLHDFRHATDLFVETATPGAVVGDAAFPRRFPDVIENHLREEVVALTRTFTAKEAEGQEMKDVVDGCCERYVEDFAQGSVHVLNFDYCQKTAITGKLDRVDS